ncbi:MAG: TrkH family potassium uptake protein [Anaerovoracaceae bacterium]|jgi:trk system potassium uptake protein TrkH
MSLNFPAMIKILSFITVLVGLSMIPSALVSVYYAEYDAALRFAMVILPILAVGLVISAKVRATASRLKLREGYLAVALSWLLASLIGCLPYLATGTIDGFVNAFFESVSGFTTTGASSVTNVEILPKGVLFWRSFCQWLGGMGILIFAISILPALGIGGQNMAKAETPGISLSKVVPRMTDSAKILYIIYIVFTLAAVILLKLGGLSLFDSFIAALGSTSSGGLSNYNEGISHFNSGYVEIIASFFTVLACINFTLYYSIIQGKWKRFFSDHELRTFLLILAAGGLFVTASLWLTGSYDSIGESLRHGLFQSTAFITTTGHFSADFNLWPAFSKTVLLLLMLIGASSASTGGGIKVIRIIALFRLIQRGIYMRLHPRAVVPVKIQGRTISSEMVSGIMSFLALYTFIFVLSVLILSLENLDFLTTVTTVAATLNNVGTGMGLVGPEGSFAMFSDFSKIYLCFVMLMGRLELFTVILLFTPSFWNPDR